MEGRGESEALSWLRVEGWVMWVRARRGRGGGHVVVVVCGGTRQEQGTIVACRGTDEETSRPAECHHEPGLQEFSPFTSPLSMYQQ